MTDPAAARAFLAAEVEALQPFDFVAVIPSDRPLHIVEAIRDEDGHLEVRVPGRPRPFPQLEIPTREALRERGFASEDASDRMKPWAKAVPSGEDAADVMQELLVDVFGEKPDVSINVGHGSYRVEHEAEKNLALARERIESIVTDLLGRRPTQDEDGDYVLPIGDVHVTVAPRAASTGQIVIRIFAVTNVAVSVTPELGLFLARLNFGLMFGRFALDTEHRSIWFDESILGHEFRGGGASFRGAHGRVHRRRVG